MIAREVKCQLIHSYKDKYPIKKMCQFFGVSRSAYYRHQSLAHRDRDEDLGRMIEEGYHCSGRTYGYRRITIWIGRKYGIVVNPKRVLRVMRKLHISSVVRRKKKYPRIVQMDMLRKYPNVLHQDFQSDRPNSKWVTDITHIHTKQGVLYLSAVKDLYDGFIVAHRLSSNPSSRLVVDTLKDALKKEMVTDGLILHSDQGQQYSSHAYYVLTQGYGITQSMSRKGNCLDNACIESFFGQLKEEAIRRTKLDTFEQAKLLVDSYIHFYNYERIQLKTKLTPYEKRCQLE